MLRKDISLCVGALGLAFASACTLTISGASAPTENTFLLSEADLAAGKSEECLLDWVGKDPEANSERALQELEALGIEIKKRERIKFTTAFRNELRVGKNYDEKSPKAKAVLLTHELVHYCQREKQGDAAFDVAYADSAARWRTEVPAYVQSIRTMRAQGSSNKSIRKYIDRRMERLLELYWLYDIDPEQYERETRAIWEAAAGFEPAPSDAPLEEEGENADDAGAEEAPEESGAESGDTPATADEEAEPE